MRMVLFGAMLLLGMAMAGASSQLPIAENGFTDFSAPNHIIVMIQPRAGGGHDVNTTNAVGEAVLTILDDNDEVIDQFSVTAPLSNYHLNTSSYASGAYVGKLTIDGKNYYSNTFTVSD